MKMIDLRSDTVTKPSKAMRQAMAEAEVGDDVYGEDPTINKLEARAAEAFGREAAIFVPTGSMGNLIAARIHTQHGQEVICESRAHILDWEMAQVAAYCGCIARTVYAARGVITWDAIKPALSPKIYYRAQTGLIWCENSANIAGGTVSSLAVNQKIWAGAKAAGLPVHLDGARVFNAAVALGTDVATLTSGFDTVMFCLSKGLGAPVGSMLVSSKENIAKARVFRKALGGGMRQAGVLAAAGLIALEEGPKRLAEDHANARLLAEAVAEVPGVEIDLADVETNIVIFRLTGGDAAGFVAELKRKGVIASAIGPDAVRFVTHCDVSPKDCEMAAGLAVEVLGAMVS
jgi:threonine aldolase